MTDAPTAIHRSKSVTRRDSHGTGAATDLNLRVGHHAAAAVVINFISTVRLSVFTQSHSRYRFPHIFRVYELQNRHNYQRLSLHSVLCSWVPESFVVHHGSRRVSLSMGPGELLRD